MKKSALLFCLTILMCCFRSYATPTYSVSISTGVSDTVCSGTSLTFTATPSVAGTYGYIWNVNGTYAGSSSATYTTTTLPVGVNMVHCVLTNAAGDTIYALSDTLTITVDTLPTITPITGTDSLCVGDTIYLSDATVGGVWSSTNTTAASVGSNGMVIGLMMPPPGGGFGGPSIHIVYTVTNGCGTDSTRLRVYMGAPAGSIEISPTTICLDSSVTITDTARGGTWTSSDSTIASVAVGFGTGFPPVITEQVTGNSTGTVTITYNVTNTCGTFTETVNVTVIDCSATEVPKIAPVTNSCNIYPNPSVGTFNIMATSAKYSQANCTVSNMVGEQVKAFTINTNQETTVNIGMPTGVYFITVSAGDEKYTSKIIIMQ